MAYLQDTTLKKDTFYTGQIVKPFEPIILDALMNLNPRDGAEQSDIVIGTAVMASLDSNGNLCMHNLDNTEADKLNIYGVAVKETLSFTTPDNHSSIIEPRKVGRVLRFGHAAASFVPHVCGTDEVEPTDVVLDVENKYTVKVVVSLKAQQAQQDNSIIGGFFYDIAQCPNVDKYIEFTKDQLCWRLLDGKLYIERGTSLALDAQQLKQNS